MIRLVPPAGTPVTWQNLRNIIVSSLYLKEDKSSQLLEKIKTFLNSKYCFAASSGRAALTIVLKSLSQLSDSSKKEVIIPGYTCYSVAASILRAGLKIKPCDVDVTKLDFEYDQLEQADFSQVLAIIPSNLFGIPNNMQKVLQIARKNHVFVIDDACQSMGAKIFGQYVGKWGIAGVFSFDRGKNITAMGGGVIITDDPLLAEAITNSMQPCNHSNVAKDVEVFLKLIVYSMFFHPELYRIPNSMPFLKLGLTLFDANFSIESFDQMRAAIALEMFNKLNQINKIRRSNALYLLSNLNSSGEISVIEPYLNSYPVYLRLPLIIRSKQLRDRLIHKFLKAGIVATGLYPSAIHQIKTIQHHIVFSKRKPVNAEKLSQRILTLPTHPYVSQHDLDKMLHILNNFEKI
jgi:perosamine synthetase